MLFNPETVLQWVFVICGCLWAISLIWSLSTDIKDRNLRLKRDAEEWKRKNLTPKEELDGLLGGK